MVMLSYYINNSNMRNRHGWLRRGTTPLFLLDTNSPHSGTVNLLFPSNLPTAQEITTLNQNNV